MSDPIPQYPPSIDAFPNLDYLQQQQFNQDLGFLSFHSPCDLVAPPPEFFEFDIDSGLEGFDDQLQVFTVDQSFQIPRGSVGPLSTITTSGVSESAASDDIFSDVSSLYASQLSSAQQPQTSDLDNIFSQFEMDFQRVTVGSDYGAPQSAKCHLLQDDGDPTSFGRLPPTPPRSPPAAEKRFPIRSSFSDYGPPRRSSIAAPDYFNGIDFGPLPQGTVSPIHLNAQLPQAASPTMPIDEGEQRDPRRKYKCNACPRSFARAYNLKTHMATHDPNRLKPHVCPHRSCGRSFSRKHDLSRHLVSIHRDENKKEIGVASGNRTWCDTCGKGSVGRAQCECVEPVK
ncbi:hypothetical protein CC2G_001465 [Coprinopsis cinerea AmutBmut pab1-1]|nr:hypothetical protein CC2G_001465 [Coprinopsis cinerea AmutBmut pab1-1]